MNYIMDLAINQSFLCVVFIGSFIFKLSLIFMLTRQIKDYRDKMMFLLFYLLLVLVGAIIEDLSWVFSTLKRSFMPDLNYKYGMFFIRIAWAFNIVMYQSLSLFIEGFTQKKSTISTHQRFFLAMSIILFCAIVVNAILNYGTVYCSPFELKLFCYESIYTLLVLMPCAFISISYALRKHLLPRILHVQLKTVIYFIMFPHLIANVLQIFPVSFSQSQQAANLSAVAMSVIFLNMAIYFCFKKIIGLRFLNIYPYVSSSFKIDFIENFKNSIEQLSSNANANEIKILSQQLFSKVFYIQSSKINLLIRDLEDSGNDIVERSVYVNSIYSVEIFVEQFLALHNLSSSSEIMNFLYKEKVIVYDEIVYDYFYENKDFQNIIITFLDKIEADVFLPIYENELMIAYIIISRDARPNKLYSNVERDEMLVFANYISKVIHFFKSRSLYEILKQRKELIDELYVKHQEINNYKESIRSFLRVNDKQIGILFYKNKKFTFGNQSAYELVPIDPSVQEGHPLSKELRNLVRQVQMYKSTQTCFVRGENGKHLVLSGIPHSDDASVIITVHYPEISDVIKRQIDMIKDPSHWDYLLYLETTESGLLINKLMPSCGEMFLNFKVELLQLAFSKKALFLDVPHDDLLDMVELLHHISVREKLYTLDLQNPVCGPETAIKLFGLNALLSVQHEVSILEFLNKNGTLFIKNIHNLDIDSQNNLAEFIRYGFFHVYKSEKKVQSDVRIICSSDQNLDILVQQKKFSPLLHVEIKKTCLIMPSLSTLSDEELSLLIDEYASQSFSLGMYSMLLHPTDKDKKRILCASKPLSFKLLRDRVRELVVVKSKQNDIYDEMRFDPAYDISDSRLVDAARLGKHALRDQTVFKFLWDKFQSQNKIALFLGVNRSSVNRRCREYGIEE